MDSAWQKNVIYAIICQHLEKEEQQFFCNKKKSVLQDRDTDREREKERERERI